MSLIHVWITPLVHLNRIFINMKSPFSFRSEMNPLSSELNGEFTFN